jgi:hypothetical protein
MKISTHLCERYRVHDLHTTETDCRLWAEWYRFRNPVGWGGKDSFCTPKRPDRHGGSPILIFYMHWDPFLCVKRPESEVQHTYPTATVVKVSGAKPTFPLHAFIKQTRTTLLLPHYTVSLRQPCEFPHKHVTSNSKSIKKGSPACMLIQLALGETGSWPLNAASLNDHEARVQVYPLGAHP